MAIIRRKFLKRSAATLGALAIGGAAPYVFSRNIAKAQESETVPGDFSTLETPCPKCGGVVKENYKKFQCQNCDFALWRILSGRQFEPAEIEELIETRQIGPLQGFRSRLGKPFAAIIKLTPDLRLEFDFGQQQSAQG